MVMATMSNLRKTAQKNQTYYLSEKEADNGKHKWFRYVRTMDSYTEPVLISPQMARELLGDSEFSLRKPMDEKALRSLVSDLKRSHPKISISFSGNLLEGHPVLQAIVASESAIVFVSFNISDKLSFCFEH